MRAYREGGEGGDVAVIERGRALLVACEAAGLSSMAALVDMCAWTLAHDYARQYGDMRARINARYGFRCDVSAQEICEWWAEYELREASK
jgi:hypothetical protein